MRKQPFVHAVIQKACRLPARMEDYRLNIRTERPFPREGFDGARFADNVQYDSLRYDTLRAFMKRAEPTSQDVIFDIGCGMGRALCEFSRWNVKACIGIEISSDLASIARSNAQSIRGRRAPIEVRVGDAADADFSDGTIFWMFNPFGADTMNAVLDRIEWTLKRNWKPIQIVYVHPTQEEVLRATPWLKMAGRKQSRIFQAAHATYWKNVPLPANVLVEPQPHSMPKVERPVEISVRTSEASDGVGIRHEVSR